MLREWFKKLLTARYSRKIKEYRDCADLELAKADMCKRRALWYRGQAAYYSAKKGEL